METLLGSLGLIPEDERVSWWMWNLGGGIGAMSCALQRPALAARASSLGDSTDVSRAATLCGDCLAATGSLLCQ